MVSRWRVFVLILLFGLPILFLIGTGGYLLWERGWWFYAWWPMAAFFALAYFLAWHWQRKGRLIRNVVIDPMHWTDRDRRAWKLVEERGKAVAGVSVAKLGEMSFFLDTAQAMADELAHFYHPKASDPFAALTIPEILAVVELASHDLAATVDQYLPGGHMLTIHHWRRTQQAMGWYQKARDAYWLISAVFSPVQTGLRFAGSTLGLSRPLQMLQDNLFVWFATAYIHQVGSYLIELYSGRLKIGAARYRELLSRQSPVRHAEPTDGHADAEVGQVTLTLIGQVKAGKSSLINALLGEQRAHTDVIPDTDEVTRYELQPKGISTRLRLLDTVGYGNAGPREDQLRKTERAAQEADVILFVFHATQPARQADVQMLLSLRNWFASQPTLKMPPVIGVLSHIDLLSPMMEWQPPYDWQKPERLKEQQIAEAIAEVRDKLGDGLVQVVPVCSVMGKTYGIEEWLLPLVVARLDEGRAVGILRCLYAETNKDKVRKTLRQLRSVGEHLARKMWQG